MKSYADIKAQMQSRVRWTESVQLMLTNGIQAYVEAGSGEVLLGMIKRIDPSASVSTGDFVTPRNKWTILSLAELNACRTCDRGNNWQRDFTNA
jgi:hypothetical protein